MLAERLAGTMEFATNSVGRLGGELGDLLVTEFFVRCEQKQ
jgi:hypothetical protein